MESMMKSADLAKKLRARQIALKKQRLVDLAKYDRAFTRWKNELAAWIEKEMPGRVLLIHKTDLAGMGYAQKLPSHVFANMPSPPRFPEAGALDSIAKMLRMLRITGEKTVKVSSREIDLWFGAPGDEDT